MAVERHGYPLRAARLRVASLSSAVVVVGGGTDRDEAQPESRRRRLCRPRCATYDPAVSTERDDKLSFPLIGIERDYRSSERREKLLIAVAVTLVVAAIALFVAFDVLFMSTSLALSSQAPTNTYRR